MGPVLKVLKPRIFKTGANIGIKSGFLQRMLEKNIIFVEWYEEVGKGEIDFQKHKIE